MMLRKFPFLWASLCSWGNETVVSCLLYNHHQCMLEKLPMFILYTLNLSALVFRVGKLMVTFYRSEFIRPSFNIQGVARTENKWWRDAVLRQYVSRANGHINLLSVKLMCNVVFNVYLPCCNEIPKVQNYVCFMYQLLSST